jgi:general secretion pathway protein D
MQILALNSIKKPLLALSLTMLIGGSFSSIAAKSCDMRSFNIKVAEQVTTNEILAQLSNECGFSIVTKDAFAKEKLDQSLFGINIKDMTLSEIFDILVTSKGLSYSYHKNILELSGLKSKTFKIDYVNSERVGRSNTDISLTGDSDAIDGDSGKGGGSLSTGATITSNDKFSFWAKIEAELSSLLNTPTDKFKAPTPIINREAGLITISGTDTQLQRIASYIDTLMSRLHKQVMIDVKILTVNLDDSKSTGINWSEIYKMQNMKLNYGLTHTNNIGSVTYNTETINGQDYSVPTYELPNSDYDGFPSSPTFNPIPSAGGSFFKAGATITITELLNFLKTQGDVTSVSNPKVVTLNNQPAVFSSGDQLYYKLSSSSRQSGANAATENYQNEIVKSVFAGILLDITPEITDDDEVILKINPSISSVKGSSVSDATGVRRLPPDLMKKQISSVVKVRDGEKIVLGGLINSRKGKSETKVPVLGNIPLLGYAFKQDKITDMREELVIIITPHIIKSSGKKQRYSLSLKDLGYKGIK